MCDIARYIAIYRDIMSRIMRYHKIRYIEISYHIYIPNFGTDIWRYRIPSIYFSIPNTIFCQLGAPSLVRQENQESKRNGYLAIELQTSSSDIYWKVNIYIYICGCIDRSCVTGTRLCNMFV